MMVLYKFTYLASAILHPAAIVILPRVAHHKAIPLVQGVHGLALLLLAFGLWRRKNTRIFRAVMAFTIIMTLFTYATLTWYCSVVLHSPRDILLASASFLGVCGFALQLYPAKFRVTAAVGAACILAAAVATTSMDGGLAWLYIFALTVSFSLGLRFTLDYRLLSEARGEFRFRSQIAPAHIVRRATDQAADLQTVFRPALKFCVCIASDWRNYQEITASLAPSQLTMALSEYYDLCQSILLGCMPEGNFFTDWIADEFFVVAFAVEGQSESELVDAALRFSIELIQAKEEFCRIHGLPRAIDIGLSSGEALLGLMGPPRHLKATALGEIPGRARRFQGGGKLARRRLGEADRILFGRESLMRVSGPFDVRSLELGASESVRDLKDREMFYIEPRPVAVELLGRGA